MSVTPINNQPIRFQNVNTIDESCDCLGQNFCQLVNQNDLTQFQLNSTDQITNGDFESNLDGWEVYEAIDVSAVITNESETGECDGELEISATGGTAPYTYSIDGGSFSGTFTFTNLCSGFYTITVKDADGNEGSLYVEVFTNVVCGDYEGATIQDLIDNGITLGQLYNCTLGDLQP
jgi:hypothetical protein